MLYGLAQFTEHLAGEGAGHCRTGNASRENASINETIGNWLIDAVRSLTKAVSIPHKTREFH
jgi:hypothetical protein